jgi:hypothetical protein
MIAINCNCYLSIEHFDHTSIKLEFPMDSNNPVSGSKYYRNFAIFKDLCSEDWIKYLLDWYPSVRMRTWFSWSNLLTRPECFGLWWRFKTHGYSENHFRKRLEAEDSELPCNELLEQMLGALYIGLELMPKRAIRVQKYYWRQSRGWPQPLPFVFSWRTTPRS